MPRAKGTEGRVGRQGRMKWSREMRLCLHLLHTEFDISRPRRTEAFNSIFAQHLAACGYHEGARANVLDIQYYEKKNPNKPDWPSICKPPVTAQDAEQREELRGRIRDALSAPTASPPDRSVKGSTSTPPQRPLSSRQHSANTKAPRVNRGSLPTPSTDGPQPASSGTSIFRDSLADARYTSPTTPTPAFVPGHAKAALSNPQVQVQGASNVAPNGRRRMQPTPPNTIGTVSKITNNPSIRLQPSTPSKSPRKKPPRQPMFPHQRRDGSTIMVPRKTLGSIVNKVELVPEWKAHPPLPGLLFRVWHEDPTCDRNSADGFWARKYHKSNVVPHVPPKSTSIDPVDVFNHMDRKEEKSPFISTSSRLLWIVQLLLKGLKDGDASGRLTMIDTSALDKRTVFYARPFHDALVKTYGFSKGAQRYHGTYEYIVWRNIPRAAIIHTIKADDLLNLATSSDAISDALRFEILRLPNKSLVRTKVPMLQEDSVQLTPDIVVGISQLCLFFGLDAHSPVEHISHIVSDIIEGWSLKVEYREQEQWQQLATLFARKVCKQSAQPITFKERELVKLAFLNGVAWGCGDANAPHKQELIVKKTRKSSAIGLASPAKIIANQLDAAKFAVLLHEKTESRRLETYHQQRLLQPAGEEDDENQQDDDDVLMYDSEDEMEDVQPPPAIVYDDDEILYDDDELML